MLAVGTQLLTWTLPHCPEVLLTLGLSGAEPGRVTRRRVHLTPDVHLIDCVPEEAVEILVTCSHMLEMLNTYFHRILPRNDFDFSIFVVLLSPLPFHCQGTEVS